MPSASLSHLIVFSAISVRTLSDSFDDGRDTHAAADAQRDQRAARIAALELGDHLAGDHGPGGSQRVTHGDGTAVDVELLVGNVEVLLKLQLHGRERLVQL